METRKAQLTGGSTFTVSLPKEWATDIDLQTGDTLYLYPRDRTIVIEPAGDEFWETTVDIDHLPDTHVRRTIQALYTAGFDRLTLTASTDGRHDWRVVSATARELIGLETLESTATEVTLQSLLDSGTVSVEQSTVQLQQVALSMHEAAIRTLVDGDEDRTAHVVEQDDHIDRLYAMVSRHFQRSLVSLRETEELALDQSDLYDYQTTARQLERVADHAEKIATLATRFERPLPAYFADEIEGTATVARTIVEEATNTIVGDAPIETAHRALDDRDELTATLEDLGRELHERDVHEGYLIALTLDSLTRTAEYGGNIAETALQSAAREHRL